MKNKLIILVLLLVFQGCALLKAEKRSHYFDVDLLYDVALNALEAPLLSNSKDDLKSDANILYAFVFQGWVFEKTNGKSLLLKGKRKQRLWREVKDYVKINDPLLINSFYVNGRLDSLKKNPLEFQPLKGMELLFYKKSNYEKFVEEFLDWLQELDRPNHSSGSAGKD